MLIERSELLIAEGKEDDFVTMMTERGLPLLTALPGVNSVQFGRGVENSKKFMLMIEWETMVHHIAFTKAASFPAFLEMLRPYSVGGSMEHFIFG